MPQASVILEFWFSKQDKWFSVDPHFDEEIKNSFLATYEQATQGILSSWQAQAESMLALIIVLDQFPRNIFRDTAAAFASDQLALSCTKKALEQDYHLSLATDEQRQFLYLPLMHSESLPEQEQSVQLFSKLNIAGGLDFAIAHQRLIAKFGRFPHRNKILQRPSTPAELEYLRLCGPNPFSHAALP